MVKFTDGPAAGQCLGLHRAPIFLRVVQGVDKKFDALDQVDDEPRFTERIFVYIRTEYHGMVHICRSKKAGGSGFFAHATYKHFETQPGDDVLRNNFRWQRWANEQYDAMKGKEAKPCDGQESPTGD